MKWHAAVPRFTARVLSSSHPQHQLLFVRMCVCVCVCPSELVFMGSAEGYLLQPATVSNRDLYSFSSLCPLKMRLKKLHSLYKKFIFWGACLNMSQKSNVVALSWWISLSLMSFDNVCIVGGTLHRSGVFMGENASLEKLPFEVQPWRDDPRCAAMPCYTLLGCAMHVICSRYWACELWAVSKTTSITGPGAFRLSFAKLMFWTISSDIIRLWCSSEADLKKNNNNNKVKVALSLNTIQYSLHTNRVCLCSVIQLKHFWRSHRRRQC